MNMYQANLYNNLIYLVDTNEAFYYGDRELDDRVYRLFNYRLASYTDFLLPGAIECRGIMFDITDPENVDLVSMPMEKFFNLYENPSTMDLDLTTVVDVELKADGSLISTYLHNGELRLKTKGSIESDQCIAAMKYLERDEHADFKVALGALAELGYTINMEWCAPDNRIVLGYMEPVLTVLNVRRNWDGEYTDIFKPSAMGNETWNPIREAYIEKIEVADPVHFAQSIPDMEGVEGYVIRLASGQRVKVKTLWYLVQHRAKDSINSPRRLFETVLAEATDDLRSLFHDDPLVIQRIEEMELFVEGKYNHLVDTVERFYERNKHMERKDYAILGQKELEKMHFGLAMSKYTGKPVNYKEFMAKKWKEFGLKDEELDNE
jgi:T4 RnlA family RNA ligase